MRIRKSLINFVLILWLMMTSLSITNTTSWDTSFNELDWLINSLMDTSTWEDTTNEQTNIDTQVDTWLDAITSNTEPENVDLWTDLNTMLEDNSASVNNKNVMLEPENTTNTTDTALEETNVSWNETAVSIPINNNTTWKLSAAWMWNFSMLLLALISSIWYFIYRRKQKIT